MRNYERRLANELRRGQFLEMTILKLKEEIRKSSPKEGE
tara:strand:- start:1753 stop:1869 length:117 start_codon:yes stop_codon:yes gene_type:complete